MWTQPHVIATESGLFFQPVRNVLSVSVSSWKSHRRFFRFTLKVEIK